jgi:hypothetical protein
VREAPKALLIELSKQLERHAMRLGETAIVAAAFQEAPHVTPATRQRYRDLVDRVGFVAALGEGLPAEPLPGVRGADLSPTALHAVAAPPSAHPAATTARQLLAGRGLGSSRVRTPTWRPSAGSDGTGAVVQYIGIQSDVTARVRAERALQTEHDRCRDLQAWLAEFDLRLPVGAEPVGWVVQSSTDSPGASRA